MHTDFTERKTLKMGTEVYLIGKIASEYMIDRRFEGTQMYQFFLKFVNTYGTNQLINILVPERFITQNCNYTEIGKLAYVSGVIRDLAACSFYDPYPMLYLVAHELLVLD